MIKRFLPRGLLARTLLILILPVFILQGFGVYLFYERHWDKLAQRLATSVAGDIGLVAEWYEEDSEFLNPSQRVRLRRYVDLDAEIGDPAQTKSLNDPAHYSYLKKALTNMLDGRPFELFNPAGQNFTVVIQTARGPMNIEVPKRRLYSSTTYIFVLWLVGLTFLLLTIAAVFMKRQIKPILRLASVAWSQNRGNVPLKLEGAEEVRRATAAFMDMQERIKRDHDQRHAILEGVREDLQKPIDRIRLMLDTVLPTHPDTPSMLSDLRAMERMIDGYLSYIRDNRDEPMQAVKLFDLLKEAQRLSGVSRLRVEFDENEDVTIMARPLALTRAFANIIRHAGNYDADLLVVDARPIHTDDGQMLLMCLEDNGQGMDEKAMREALHPMELTQDWQKHQRDLGLAIAADIINGHEGKLELSKGVKGLRVILMLPA